MKPLQFHYDPDSRFSWILNLFIRSDARRPPGYRQTTPPGSVSGDETEGTTEYYQLARSDVANSDAGKTQSDEEEIEL